MKSLSAFGKAVLSGSVLLVFFTVFAVESWARASVNIPAGSWIYGGFERLEVKGLITSGILSTKPFGRSEGARLVDEALENAERAGGRAAMPVIGRLAAAFAGEAGPGPRTYIKPVESASLGYLYSEHRPYFPLINNNGHGLGEGHNVWAGLALTAEFDGRLALYLNPEYRLGDGSSSVRPVHAYAKAGIGPFEIQAGKDTMWWGPGYHGGLLMTNNAEPLEMVKASTEHPVLLPWAFRRLGPFRPTLFLARLEEERDFPRANLLGMRLDFRPAPAFRLGLSRVIMFGGEGRKSLGASDWVGVIFATDSAEHENSPIDNNQIVSVDASYIHVNRSGPLPWSGLKLYAEAGAEDSSGQTRTPTARAYLFGAYMDEPFSVRNADIRVEYASTARKNRQPGAQWYRHHVYRTGYTYKGRVIGHHMGPDATDLFIRGQYHSAWGVTIGAEADWERSLVHESGIIKRRWLAADASLPLRGGYRLSGRAGIERIDGPLDKFINPVAGIGIERFF